MGKICNIIDNTLLSVIVRKYKLSIIKLGINGDKEVEFMSSVISQEGMQKALSWAWDKSLNGVPGIGTAEELAESYLNPIYLKMVV